MKKIICLSLTSLLIFSCGGGNSKQSDNSKEKELSPAEAALTQKYQVHETADTKTITFADFDEISVYINGTCIIVGERGKDFSYFGYDAEPLFPQVTGVWG